MLKKFIALGLSIVSLSMFSATAFSDCSKQVWVKNKYPYAYDYKWFPGGAKGFGYVKVYESSGSYFIVDCEKAVDGRCFVCD